MPPLKYAPTGQQKIEKIYSGAELTPTLSPTPIKNGRKYSVAPLPYGPTHSSLAFTTCLQASTNISTDTSGIKRRWQLRCIRLAFSSGRNKLIEPYFVRYAFSPSKHC